MLILHIGWIFDQDPNGSILAKVIYLRRLQYLIARKFDSHTQLRLLTHTFEFSCSDQFLCSQQYRIAIITLERFEVYRKHQMSSGIDGVESGEVVHGCRLYDFHGIPRLCLRDWVLTILTLSLQVEKCEDEHCHTR
jgi:hypothetical protein